MDNEKCYNTDGATINGVAIHGLKGVKVSTNVELENDPDAGIETKDNQALGR
jgi:hypothetical protein